MSDPKSVLKEYRLEMPDGMDVTVVENADDCVHITLPAAPGGAMDLSDDELSNAAGGMCCPSHSALSMLDPIMC